MQHYRRPRGKIRPLEKRIIISCEGQCSEPYYLDRIRSELRIKKERVSVVAKGQMPLTAVESAIKKRNKLIQDRAFSAEDGDEVWAVFDGEEHREGSSTNEKNWKEALRLAEAEKIKLANSEPCIELWFLLHYQDRNARFNREKVKELLKKYHPDYDKGDKGFFDQLRKSGNEAKAKERADNLRTIHKRNSNDPHFTNPCTRMDELVTAIQALAK